METPICVTDAQTFVDHVHEIKSWIYNGQLRLIIPSSLPENVEMLYQKSLEPKPTQKEAPKPKTLGKPAKKEYPTFDANPKVAKAFIARVQAGKGYQTGAFGRPIYEEEENHAAVHFATASEQYSAWKDVEDVEENVDSPADHIESWAEKLKRKQAVANGNTEKKTKGPVKPKLVAKIVADSSPWKMQKNAPTISGTDVPAGLRPMMSCSLWRIHESIHRNDENQVFMLTNQTPIRELAQKLNVPARSTKDLAQTIQESKPPAILNTFGGLEQEFGVQPVKERRPIRCTAMTRGTSTLTNGSLERKESPSKDLSETKTPVGASKSITNGSVAPPIEAATHLDQQKRPVRADKKAARQEKSENIIDESQGEIADAKMKEPMARAAKVGKEGEVPVFTNVSGHANEASLPNGLGNHLSATTMETADTPIERVGAAFDGPQQAPSSMWDRSRSFADALSGNRSKKTSAPIERNSPVATGSGGLPVKPPEPKPESVQEPPSTPTNAPDSPDSDEEVVVFQPKRLSAQRKPVRQNSRPTTPNFQPQAIPTTAEAGGPIQPPKVSEIKRQVTPKTTLKQIPHVQKPLDDANNRQPSSKMAPTVIDPDAFGRGFAVNTNQNARGSLRRARPQHSPQPSLFDAGISTSRPSSSHPPQRSSPSRPSPKFSPKEASKVSVHADRPNNDAQRKHTPPFRVPSGTQLQQMPIGTGRPPATFDSPVTPFADDSVQAASAISPVHRFSTPISAPTLNANAPVFQPGGVSNLIFQPPLRRGVTTPKSNPPMQPPIGSGRPKSKTSEEKAPQNVEALVDSAKESLPSEPAIALHSEIQAPTGPRKRGSNFARLPSGPSPQHAALAPRGQHLAQTQPRQLTPNPNRHFGPQTLQNGDSQRSLRGRSGANIRLARPVKPSLFEPELDHTRAYQPETAEAKKSAVPEVQYVLKSGSTREEARGKGKLWVG